MELATYVDGENAGFYVWITKKADGYKKLVNVSVLLRVCDVLMLTSKQKLTVVMQIPVIDNSPFCYIAVGCVSTPSIPWY